MACARRRWGVAARTLHSNAVVPRLALLLLLAGLPVAGGAESALRLPLPDHFGHIPAATYAESGERLGDAAMSAVRLPSGHVLLEASSGIDGSARTAVLAELEPVDGGEALRIVRERSESLDEQGLSLGVLSIDHERGIARCGVPHGSDKEAAELELPDVDRVANVPLNLLFERLVDGADDEVSFQVLLCRFGARIIDARAAVARSADHDGSQVIEVEYNVDFGPFLSKVASPFLPKLSFWFDPKSPGTWVGHRIPLYSKGPTVVVMRTGFTPGAIVVGP